MNEMSDQINARQHRANDAAHDDYDLDYQATLKEYRAMVKRLQAPILLVMPSQREDIILHAVLGIGDEAGELTSIVKRHLVYGEAYSGEHILEEMGDLFHYMTYLMLEYSWTLEDVMRANTEKLVTGKDPRYPKGFTTEAALERADKNVTPVVESGGALLRPLMVRLALHYARGDLITHKDIAELAQDALKAEHNDALERRNKKGTQK